jgi:hypothetical protein
MPGRRPWKADCADGSTAGNVAVVVVSLFGHEDGVERTVGVPGVGSASALATPRSCLEIPSWRQRATKFSGAVCGCFRAKVQRLGANHGDACGCRNPLGGVVVGIRPVLWLRVKTLDLTVSTMAADCVVTLLGASLWSPDSTRSVPMSSLVLVFLVLFCLSFDLLCKRFSSPPCIGSAVAALFIKRGECLFREKRF